MSRSMHRAIAVLATAAVTAVPAGCGGDDSAEKADAARREYDACLQKATSTPDRERCRQEFYDRLNED